jgi:transcriptional regulator with XRE-family HTH domain
LYCHDLYFVHFRETKWLIEFGKNLKRIRGEKKFTQEKLAYESGLALSQIARLEVGDRNPTLCTIIVIAKTLKVEPGELLNSKFK